MTITKQEFSELKKGDAMVGSDGRSWPVVSDAGRRDSSTCIGVQGPHGKVEGLKWMDLGEGCSGIANNEGRFMMKLNYPGAHIS